MATMGAMDTLLDAGTSKWLAREAELFAGLPPHHAITDDVSDAIRAVWMIYRGAADGRKERGKLGKTPGTAGRQDSSGVESRSRGW